MPRSAPRLRKPSELRIALETGGAVSGLVYEADRPCATLVLAHGAGAGQLSAFMIG